uniref:Phospholipid-transporting ATPase n=1 Tax=Scophthalmus maximus TaxID=52904 RepID=A0A8D3BNZ0_SCOMX
MLRWIRQQLGFDPPHQSETRTIYVANRFPQHGHYVPQRFADNRIISSKYTIWNFVPKNLFEQFRRIANFYFLIIFLVQLMIDTPTSPITSGLPLFFVITVTAIKQGYEDWLRHKADNEVNGAPVFVVRSGSLVQTRSKNIRVGDIVRVAKDETFPVDLVLLSSDRADGTCHITTTSLDGETNLKTHYSVGETAVCQSVSQLEALQAVVECQQPDADLYRFVGRITVTQHGEEIVRPLGPENLLLRGARLKNTKEIFGVAVYTGMESKMALNYKCKSQKRSAVEKSMNTFLLIYLCILLFEAILSTILKYAWQAEDKWDEPFYNQKTEQERNSSPILKFISDFLAFMVLYNFIIPISLYVTVEMQKFLGSFFICWDLDLYHEESDQKAQVNTSDLNEELGQVEYVFTDKTGTLTENEMQFRECSINGTKYREVNGKLVPEGMTDDSPDGSLPQLMGEELLFLKAVSLCHTVQISYDQPDCLGGGGDPFAHANGFSSNHMEYYASSPDEKALVEAAKRIGVAFTRCSGETMEIKTFGQSEKYKLLHVLEFDADRRRMSVILQTPSGGQVLFTKGAESAILPFTTSGEIEKTRLHVDEFALKGLRTLVVACRHFSPEEYIEVDRCLNSARTALQQREERLQEAFSYTERDLQLLGATGVEDKLQDKVQETIEALRLAGIKVWVLTGDKHETAVSVSLSCGHFHRTMNILELLQQRSDNECAEQLRRLDRRIKEDHVIQHGLVVDGASLSLALRKHEKLFMEVCKNCSAVLCCRMAPLQKAKVVRLFKTSPEKPITLAIGDGANDVSMIQEAHVGIGIMGKEGRQAVRNSDYAIARFKFLAKLLLVHGHFYYIRIATLVQYFFYKNVCFITPQFLYQFFCLFSQQGHQQELSAVFSDLPVLDPVGLLSRLRLLLWIVHPDGRRHHTYGQWTDVWKLDVWNAGLHSYGHHCHLKARFRDSFLDVDEPFCDMGFNRLLLHLLSLLRRHHLAIPPHPGHVLCVRAAAIQRFCLVRHHHHRHNLPLSRRGEEDLLPTPAAHQHTEESVSTSPRGDPQLCGVPVLLPAWAERLFPPGPLPGANDGPVPGRCQPLPGVRPQQQVLERQRELLLQRPQHPDAVAHRGHPLLTPRGGPADRSATEPPPPPLYIQFLNSTQLQLDATRNSKREP